MKKIVLALLITFFTSIVMAQSLSMVTATDLAPFYIAMALDSDPALVKKVSEATIAVLASGKFEKIVNSYKY